MTRPHTLSSRRGSGWMPLRTAGPCSNLTNMACLLEGHATDQGALLGRAPGGHHHGRLLAGRALRMGSLFGRMKWDEGLESGVH